MAILRYAMFNWCSLLKVTAGKTDSSKVPTKSNTIKGAETVIVNEAAAETVIVDVDLNDKKIEVRWYVDD